MPISDPIYKQHLALRGIKNITNQDNYATELGDEMKLYCQSRLQNVQINVKAIIKRLKDLKV